MLRRRSPAPIFRSTVAGPLREWSFRARAARAADDVPHEKSLASLLPGRAANPQSSPPTKRINLALQGGGAHGAFTWGVLEQLLSDERISIEGISGTSAGAVNAVMLADGLARGGREEAQKRLADFWRAVEHVAICRHCSAPWWSGCSRSCRSRARRCRPGSTRWRAISRRTTSIRSTSIRSKS